MRPIFKHELLEDIQNAQTIKHLQKSPSPAKNSGFIETEEDEVENHAAGLNSDTRTGCVRFTLNQPQMITLDARPKEPLKEYVFRSVFKPDSTQLEVFERTALPLVMHVLNGYNGTYFVYG